MLTGQTTRTKGRSLYETMMVEEGSGRKAGGGAGDNAAAQPKPDALEPCGGAKCSLAQTSWGLCLSIGTGTGTGIGIGEEAAKRLFCF